MRARRSSASASMAVAMLLLLVVGTKESSSARILGVFPHVGGSHFVMFRPLLKTLASRGHDVVVVSHFPLQTPTLRYTDVVLDSTAADAYVNNVPFDEFGDERVAPTLNLLSTLAAQGCASVLSQEPVTRLLRSNVTFDLVMYELFNTDCFLGVVHKYGAPSIAMSSSSMMPWASARFANPDNPAYVANHFLALSDRMSFVQRLRNAVYYVATHVYYACYMDAPANKIARLHFGDSLPPLSAIAANTSLLLVNTHHSYGQVRPLVPAVVEVGGIHVETPQRLPPDLDRFLSEARHGVVYMSLGSTVRTATLPTTKRKALLLAFSELPQRVLWKWEEEDTIVGKSDNVMVSKWLPQTAVLAHPNVKVFVTHGGLMGTIEAVHYGVPMVSIPLFGDQYHNVEMCVSKGIAVKVPYPDLSKDTMLAALREVLNNRSYAARAKEVSRMYHDRPMTPMDTAVYWVEYVLRHGGAPYLRPASLQLAPFQYLLLDVVAAVAVAVALAAFVAARLAGVVLKLVDGGGGACAAGREPKMDKKKRR